MIRILALTIACCLALGSEAQPLVDIRLVDDGKGALLVKVRPDGDFTGLFSSLVFTLRWKASTGATLGKGEQSPPELQYMTTNTSGPMTEDGGYRYQIYAGFGMVPLTNARTSWKAGEEVTLMRIPVNGTAAFEIVNDAWTAKKNGDYYAALNGLNKTGSVLSK
jgi:hypothetical protein